MKLTDGVTFNFMTNQKSNCGLQNLRKTGEQITQVINPHLLASFTLGKKFQAHTSCRFEKLMESSFFPASSTDTI